MTEQIRLPEQNKVFISGRVTWEPELRFTPSKQAVTTFGIAANRNYKDQQTGEWKEFTSFVSIVSWGKQAELCVERLKKGNAVFVEGRLQSRSWESKTGEKRTSLEVVADRIQFLTKAYQSDSGSNTNSVKEDNSSENISDPVPAGAGLGEEDIPF
jgi:single-strand DNA-binding protein